MSRITIDQLYALAIPEVQEMFLNIMQDTVDDAILSEMIEAIENNDEEALFRATGFTPAVLAPILDRIEALYGEGAEIESDGWPKRLRTPSGMVKFVFNMRNPIAERELKENSSSLVTNINNNVRDGLRLSMQEGIRRGQNPRKTALQMIGTYNPTTKKRQGGSLGLTKPQTQWSYSALSYLETLDEKYFSLGLRDKRFDKTVRKAIDSGQPMNQKTVDQLHSAYKSKLLNYRASVISQTETIQSINRGQHAVYEQAMAEGAIHPEAVTKEWDDVHDSVTRPSHKAMGIKYGKMKGIPFRDPFVTPSGEKLKHPGDTSFNASGKEVILCRCKAKYRVDFTYGVEL